MTNALANLTHTQLVERLAKIEALGKATAAEITSGKRGDVVSSHMVRGRWADTRRNEAALNWQRLAWKDTKAELNRRAAEAVGEMPIAD